jgi:hypothetical protein
VKEKFGLTVPQVNLAADVLPDRLRCHPDELHTAACALRAAAMVCEIAAALHEKEGREVLLKTACQKLYLPTAKQDAAGAGGTQELIAKMFGPVHVDLIDPIASRRDPWESKLVANRGCDTSSIFNKKHPPTMESDEQPDCCLTCANIDCIDGPAHQKRHPECSAIDGSWGCVAYKQKPECCAGCVNSYLDCVHSPEEDGECVGRETVSFSVEQPEDLTALDGEPKGDGQPEICSSCNHSILDMRYPAGL